MRGIKPVEKLFAAFSFLLVVHKEDEYREDAEPMPVRYVCKHLAPCESWVSNCWHPTSEKDLHDKRGNYECNSLHFSVFFEIV